MASMMRTVAPSLSAILWLLSAPPAGAQTVGDVANIAALAALGTGGNVNVRNYANPGDGGGGQFYSTSLSCVADGGVTIKGAGTLCWHRQFTGAVHMEWYGVSSATTDASMQLVAALSVAANTGYVVDTDALPLNIGLAGGTITPQSGVRLTCDAPPGGLRKDGLGYSNYTNVPGSLVLAHGQQISLSNDNTEFDHCVVLTDGGGGSPINLYPKPSGGFGAARAAMDNIENAATNGDTAIFCQAEGCNIHDNLIVGFDTAVETQGAGRFWLRNNLADANVGIYVGENGSPVNIAGFEMHSFLAGGGNYNQTDTITGIAAAPTTNYCRLTITSTVTPGTPTMDYKNGDSIDVTGIPNKLNCNGRSRVSVVDGSHLDLTDTRYPDPTTTGTFAANTQVIRVASTRGLWAGLAIGDSLGYIPSSTTVLDVSPYSNAITISKATTNTSSSGTDSLSFSNPSGSVAGSVLLFGTLRAIAGVSAGGQATGTAGGVGTCLQVGTNVGAPVASNIGVLASNIFCFGHQIEYNMANAGPVNCANCSTDTFSGVDDITRIDLMLGGLNTSIGAGHTGRLSWTNSSFAGGGGIIADLGGKGCASLANIAVNPHTIGTLGLDVVNGCVTATGMVDVDNNNAVDVLLENGPIAPSNGTLTGFSFPNSTLFYEQASVAGQFSCANNMGPVGCANSLPNDLTFASNTPPTCGSGCGSVAANSTNNAMTVTSGSAVTSETINFAGPGFSRVPTCVVNNPTTAATPRTVVSSTTPTTVAVSFSGAVSGVAVNVLCFGH